MPKRPSSEISKPDSENVADVASVAPFVTKGATLQPIGFSPISTSTLSTLGAAAPSGKTNIHSFTWSLEGSSHEVPLDIYNWILANTTHHYIVREQASLTHIQGVFLTKKYFSRQAVKQAWLRMGFKFPAMLVQTPPDVMGAIGYCEGEILSIKTWSMEDLQVSKNFYSERKAGKFYFDSIKTMRKLHESEAKLVLEQIMSTENVSRAAAEKKLQGYGALWPSCSISGPYLQQCETRRALLVSPFSI